MFHRILLLLALIVVAPSSGHAEPNRPDNRRPAVLTLHSYTSNDWCLGLQNGINHELVDRAQADMFVDYMDSRKANTQEYQEVLRQLLVIKYQTIHFDLILACDDNAYQYVTKYRAQLWPNVPIVFCGVNEFRPEEFARLENGTGISENNDLRPFISAFPQMLPDLKTLYIIRDDSTYARDTLPHLLDVLHDVTPKVQVQFLDSTLTAEEITTRLTQLPTDSAVFFLCFWQDKNGRYIGTNEGERIIAHCSVPVFTTQFNLLGQGAIGASYVDATDHGAAAARIASRILTGTPASKIPAAIGPARRMSFDHAILERFHISRSTLPPDSKLINEPFSFYRKYRALVWTTTSTIAVLATLVVLLVINVLQRRNAVARLTESEEKFAHAFNDSPVGMEIRDLETNRYMEINQQYIDTLGYSRKEVVGRLPQEIGWLSEAQLAGIAQNIKTNGAFRDIEIQFIHKDGHPVICAYTAQRVRIQGHDCVLSTIIDVTLRKRAENERTNLQTQLNQIQKMESIGRLAGGVAHDFNNMLMAIQINASLARDSVPAESPVVENLDEILNCTQRSADLTRRLLAFARKQTIAPTMLDLNATVEGMLKMLQRLMGEAISLNWQPAQNLWPVKFDASQVDQILANLCVNARDAINGVGKVSILTKNITFDEEFCAAHSGFLPGDHVLLTVSDNGGGMSKETLSHLFEPFFTTKGVGHGTGLGLATVYGIVKQNQGFINVYSEPGYGATFNIYLPRHTEHSDAPKIAAVRQKPASTGHETILLVEDEPSILRIGKRTLESAGYTVIAATTPGEAIQLAAQRSAHIDLLLTDVIMPDMTGRDLSKKILELSPTTKCLFMSGYTADVIASQGVLEEDINFIQKPFTIQDLTNRVRAALDETSVA